MPAAVVDGLEPDQLIESLSFEAETLTGVPASDSAVDAVRQNDSGDALSDLRRFWITQVPNDVRSKFEDAIRRVNSKLAGIAHPGGLPRAHWDAQAAAETSTEWRRLEVWNQLTLNLHGRPDGVVETRVIRSSPGSEGWLAELPEAGPISWMGPTPANRIGPDGRRVTLLSAGGIPLEPEKIDLPANEAPVDWLRAWIGELTAVPRRVPCVPSSSVASPNRKYFLIGGLAASLALAVCAAHGTVLTVRTNSLHSRADRLLVEKAQMAGPDTSAVEVAQITSKAAALGPSLDNLNQDVATLQSQRDAEQKTLDTINAEHAQTAQLQAIHRRALPELLAALADSEKNDNANNLVVKEVRQDAGSNLRLTGLCRTSAFADAFATKLETRLSKAGWLVSAAQKQLREDQQAFNFSIELTPAVRFKGWGIEALEGPSTAPASSDSPVATSHDQGDPASPSPGGRP
jgi:hypothetical protein